MSVDDSVEMILTLLQLFYYVGSKLCKHMYHKYYSINFVFGEFNAETNNVHRNFIFSHNRRNHINILCSNFIYLG